MEFLKLLESIRTPMLDSFFSIVTHLGEETLLIVVGLVFFWCIDKKNGYYIMLVGFLGTIINQFLKLWFRIPRPWIKDESFTIVESARAEATGYSFPSGHTQTAVGVFGCLGRSYKNVIVRIICIILCVLVPFSRMYLGVHTPADVGVSLVMAVILVFGLYPIMNKAMVSKKTMRIFMACFTVFAAAFVIFVNIYNFPVDIDMDNLEHGIKNAYKILGCVLALWLTYEIDEKYIHFETTAVWWVQIIKFVIGLLPILAIKSGLKEPLYILTGGSYAADGIRYFLLTVFAGCVWPITFKYLNKLSKKE